VIQDELKLEAEARRFLLGEMSEDERSGFEENFVADADLFEQIRACEDELIESYIRRTLSRAEREKFERNFLKTERRRKRVEFTRAMLDKLNRKTVGAEKAAADSSAWNSILDFFRTPKLVFGAAFAVLLLAFGFWLLILKSPKKDFEIAREAAPTPFVSATPQIIQSNSNSGSTEENKTPVNNELENPSKNQNSQNGNSNVGEREKPGSIPKITVALALFPGTTRSEGKTGELNLPKDAKGANLQLNLEAEDYKIYRAEIVDAEGSIIFRTAKLNRRGTKISTFVPAEKLRKGDYIIKLYGFNSQNEEESAADYQFRVNRK
jgi:hypothetical protein